MYKEQVDICMYIYRLDFFPLSFVHVIRNTLLYNRVEDVPSKRRKVHAATSYDHFLRSSFYSRLMVGTINDNVRISFGSSVKKRHGETPEADDHSDTKNSPFYLPDPPLLRLAQFEIV